MAALPRSGSHAMSGSASAPLRARQGPAERWCRSALLAPRGHCGVPQRPKGLRVSAGGERGPWFLGKLWAGDDPRRRPGDSQLPPAPAPPQAQAQPSGGGLEAEQLTTIETNIDDMSPQLLAYTSEKLLQAGALDVWTIPAIMKKGRPGMVLNVLCAPALVNSMLTVIFYETTTMGVRIRPCERVSVQRVIESARTQWGWVPVKAAFINGQLVTATAEYEDCAAIARDNNIPLKIVKAAAENAYLESELRERQALDS